MLSRIKKQLGKTWVGKTYEHYQCIKDASDWVRNGLKGSPPHLIKQRIIRKYRKRFNCKVLVETGTYLGDMVYAMRKDFKEIHSVELGRDLYERAKIRFDGYPHIHLYAGDSGETLEDVLCKLKRPCLFWLDAHYSAGMTAKGASDTPIEKELKHIFRHEYAHQHVLLIDDARVFNGNNDYPTLLTIETTAKQAGYHSFSVEDDIIRICNPVYKR